MQHLPALLSPALPTAGALHPCPGPVQLSFGTSFALSLRSTVFQTSARLAASCTYAQRLPVGLGSSS